MLRTRVAVESLPELEEMTRAPMKTTEEMHAILDDLARRAEIEPAIFDELNYLFHSHGVYVLTGALYQPAYDFFCFLVPSADFGFGFAQRSRQYSDRRRYCDC